MKNDIVKELLIMVNKALDKLYNNDKYLIEKNSTERNIVFHFSRYFIELLDANEFKEINVDCEYDRNAFGEKEYKSIVYNYDKKEHKVYPDFILHKRGSNDKNILAIEFKKYNNKKEMSLQKDEWKLKALTNSEGKFKYKLGLHIIFEKERKSVKIKKYINGKAVRG